MTRLTLISFDLCPFVQRSAILLHYKNIPFERVNIDLAQKPDWFTQLSPHGKVPVLQVEGRNEVLFESLIIAEYIDETEEPKLHPDDPLLKARHRSLMTLADVPTASAYMLMVAETKERAFAVCDNLVPTLAQLEDMIRGPYFDGDFSMVDVAFAPGLQRLYWCDSLTDEIDLFSQTPKVKAWTEQLLRHPAVVASMPANIFERFKSYLAGDHTETHKTEPSWLGQHV